MGGPGQTPFGDSIRYYQSFYAHEAILELDERLPKLTPREKEYEMLNLGWEKFCEKYGIKYYREEL